MAHCLGLLFWRNLLLSALLLRCLSHQKHSIRDSFVSIYPQIILLLLSVLVSICPCLLDLQIASEGYLGTARANALVLQFLVAPSPLRIFLDDNAPSIYRSAS